MPDEFDQYIEKPPTAPASRGGGDEWDQYKEKPAGPDPTNPAANVRDPKQDILTPGGYRERTAASPYAPAGQAEEAMGEGRSTGEILKDAGKPVALGAATVLPMATGGMSVPVQMGVGGLTGFAQDKLEGGSNREALTSGAIGAVLPAVGPAGRAISESRTGKVALGALKGAAERIPIVGPMGKSAIRGGLKAWRDSAPTIDAFPSPELSSGSSKRLALPAPEMPPVAPSGRVVLTPQEAQQEERQLALAKRMASQRGMQYAAGMKPTPPSHLQ